MPTSFWDGKRILVTGGAGFVGTRVVSQIMQAGHPEKIYVPRSKSTDLRVWEDCVRAVKDIDIVIHLAANIGGIEYNQNNPGRLFYDNAIMGIQLLEAARKEDVDKVVIAGTICAYPNYTPLPFSEEDLWCGYPEPTNAPYGLAKKMLLVQSQAYREEYDFNSIYLLPVNLYGPGDTFGDDRSHVIPALIKRFVAAQDKKSPSVTVWGTGMASREFLYVDDCARAFVLATEKYNKSAPVNIGSGMEISIRDLSNLIAFLTNYEGVIKFDSTKPDGQPRRWLNIKRAEEEFGFRATVPMRAGLEKTILWYKQSGGTQ
jgi:GDP-L-fucose synthase